MRFVASDPFKNIEINAASVPATRFHIIGDPLAGDARTLFRILDSDGLFLELMSGNNDLLHCKTNEVAVTLVDGRYTVVVERDGYRERQSYSMFLPATRLLSHFSLSTRRVVDA